MHRQCCKRVYICVSFRAAQFWFMNTICAMRIALIVVIIRCAAVQRRLAACVFERASCYKSDINVSDECLLETLKNNSEGRCWFTFRRLEDSRTDSQLGDFFWWLIEPEMYNPSTVDGKTMIHVGGQMPDKNRASSVLWYLLQLLLIVTIATYRPTVLIMSSIEKPKIWMKTWIAHFRRS